jgi:hypothetical protein
MADPSKTATALITLLQAITVSISPSTVGLAPSGTQQFMATVLGTSNTALTWSINPSVGTISSAGLYTAPSSILTSQTVTVTAQSVADPTKSATAAISLNLPLSIPATYYISSSYGSDTNDGLSPQNAWKSLDNIFLKAYSASPFVAGEQILLNQGDTWDGQIRVNASAGTASSPIIIGTYGSGPNPILYGDNHTAIWTAVPGHPGVYQASVGWGSILGPAYVGTTQLIFISPGPYNLINPSDLNAYLDSFTPGSYGPTTTWTDLTWVRTLDGLPPTNLSIFRGAVVYVESPSNYITIQNLDIRSSFQGINIYGSSNITVQNNSIQDALSIGIYLMGNDTNCLAENNTVTRTGNDALYVLQGISNTFRGNTVSDVTNTILGLAVGGDQAGIGLQQSTNTLVEHNSVSYTITSGVDYYEDNGSTVRYNYFYHMGAGGLYPSETGANNSAVYYNIIDEAGAGNGINAENSGSGTLLVYNNVIYGTSSFGLMSSGTGPVIFLNNIVYPATSTSSPLYISNSNTNSDYNLFYTTGTPSFSNLGIYYPSLATYQSASGQDTHSIFANPQFSSANPIADMDFRLEPSSPGIFAGKNLQAAGLVSSTEQYVDYDGVSVPQGPQPNIGAFESSGVAVGVSLSPASATLRASQTQQFAHGDRH